VVAVEQEPYRVEQQHAAEAAQMHHVQKQCSLYANRAADMDGESCQVLKMPGHNGAGQEGRLWHPL